MNNKIEIGAASKAAEYLKLKLSPAEYRGFSHIAEFAADCSMGDGELRCDDSYTCVAADELCRDETEHTFSVSKQPGTAADIAKSVFLGERSAADIAEEYLARAEADENGAYITVMREYAMKASREVDERVRNGEKLPLAGVALSVKDNICTADTRTTCASRALYDFVPDYDATVYARLVAAGAVPIGKTNMDEFAVGSDGSTSYFGKCRNPLAPSKTPGGSSSGSAASLAAHAAVISLGSDTGGSARVPASYCGLAALKPTYGAFSRFGLVGMAPSLDQICPMAGCVADLRLVFEIASGRDEKDMTTQISYDYKAKSGKIGVFLPSGATSAAVRAVERCVRILADEGYTAETVTLPLYEDILGIYYTISSAEAASNLARYDGLRYGYSSKGKDVCETRSESFGAPLRERLAEGAYVLTHNGGAPYAEALRMREKVKNSFAELFSRYDLLVTPMSETEAVNFGLAVCSAERFAVYANLTGVPAVTIPATVGDGGLPVGVQLMAQAGEDLFLLDAAQAVERRLEW